MQYLGGFSRKLLTDAFDALVLDVTEKHQVLWSVVVALAVDVMHKLARLKVSAQDVLHHESMFADVSAVVRVWVVRIFPQDIAVAVPHDAASPSAIQLHRSARFRDVLRRVLSADVVMRHRPIIAETGR
jgi:hypothetical protein